jgi:hypothetical protein
MLPVQTGCRASKVGKTDRDLENLVVHLKINKMASKPKIYRHVTANSMKLDEYPFIRELSMEAYLIENIEILQLDEDAFGNVDCRYYEIPIKGGGANKDGRIDMLVEYSEGYLGIVELKNEEIEEIALKQLEGYLADRAKLFDNVLEKEKYDNHTWLGILVGTDISDELKKELLNGYKYKDKNNKEDIPIAGITLRRLKNSDTNEIFAIADVYYKPNSKDYSTYAFDGQSYNKGRLALNVIKKYVAENPSISFSKLGEIFSIKGMKCFDTKENALAENNKGTKRFFSKPDEIIELSKGSICVSNQWNPERIKSFIEIANGKEVDYKIK